MTLKQATLIAIVGLILQLIPNIIGTLFEIWRPEFQLLYLIGILLLLHFFIVLYKKQIDK